MGNRTNTVVTSLVATVIAATPFSCTQETQQQTLAPAPQPAKKREYHVMSSEGGQEYAKVSEDLLPFDDHSVLVVDRGTYTRVYGTVGNLDMYLTNPRISGTKQFLSPKQFTTETGPSGELLQNKIRKKLNPPLDDKIRIFYEVLDTNQHDGLARVLKEKGYTTQNLIFSE